MRTVRSAFAGGWTAVKLYFMLGLPTETLDDVAGIARLAQRVVDAYYQNPNKPKGKGVQVSISVASFVPKPLRLSSGSRRIRLRCFIRNSAT